MEKEEEEGEEEEQEHEQEEGIVERGRERGAAR